MRIHFKIILLCSFFLIALNSCSPGEKDPRLEKVVASVNPEQPIVYDFDYKYENLLGESETVTKNFFQIDFQLTNKNTEVGVVIVAFTAEVTSSSSKGGVKTDKSSFVPVKENFLLSAPPGGDGRKTIYIGGLNPDAVGLTYSVKLTAKGYFSSPADENIQIDRYSQEFFFSAN